MVPYKKVKPKRANRHGPGMLLIDIKATVILKGPVRTALQTLFISVIKTNQFILQVAQIAVYTTHKYSVGRTYNC
jgi:hypothetical protein